MTDTREQTRPTISPAALVAGFLTALLGVNTYWGLGGSAGLTWVLGCDCPPGLAMIWMQEAAIAVGIALVLTRAGVWHLPLPGWIPRAGIWIMAAAFGSVGLYNLVGDNVLQARLVFAPLSLALCALCVAVARRAEPEPEPA